jgi:hypothetical protein
MTHKLLRTRSPLFGNSDLHTNETPFFSPKSQTLSLRFLLYIERTIQTSERQRTSDG